MAAKQAVKAVKELLGAQKWREAREAATRALPEAEPKVQCILHVFAGYAAAELGDVCDDGCVVLYW
jgi:hypothetical protein